MIHKIYLVHEDDKLVGDFKQGLHNGARITPLNIGEACKKKVKRGEVVVIAAEGDWSQSVQVLQEMQQNSGPFYGIISSPDMLKTTISQIEATSKTLHLGEEAFNLQTLDQQRDGLEKEMPDFDKLIEKKLEQFVKKIRHGGGENVYDLLIGEVDKPVITLVLKEMDGNQVQASQVLGIHRNTLRKKMKTLKIKSVKKKTR